MLLKIQRAGSGCRGGVLPPGVASSAIIVVTFQRTRRLTSTAKPSSARSQTLYSVARHEVDVIWNKDGDNITVRCADKTFTHETIHDDDDAFRLGGVRNWDYRYCWLRDATFTLLALMHLGYYDEAQAWRDWLVRAVAGSPQQVQIMYGVGGERWLPELIVPWLPGYENSSPVRIGNGAYEQLQLDVIGETADAIFQALKAGMEPSERGRARWARNDISWCP